MSKFNKLYEEIIKKDHPIFKPASKEEIKKRKKAKFQRWFEDEIESGNITKNPDGTYDAKDDVFIDDMGLTKIPIQFNKVDGYFWCTNNKLTSLEGAPKEVNGDFDCEKNKLTSLEGAPKEVNGDFDCRYNKLTSLKGAPEKVIDGFTCSYNDLTSLEGAPKKVIGIFNCNSNYLTSLKGAPKEVRGNFHCFNQKNNHEFTKEEVKVVCEVYGDIYV